MTGFSPKKRIVFLGSPQVAAIALEIIYQGAQKKDAEVVAIVSQPPARTARRGSDTPTPVHQFGIDHNIPVLTPEKASDPEFIAKIRDLKPDLCITAAYGQMLTLEFLSIPTFGTLNIHPSLLPRWRGAAPVQRTLENGDPISGVSVVASVLAMDAGPILQQIRIPVDPNEQAHELLNRLFIIGAETLVKALPDVWTGQAKYFQQNDADITKAKKIRVEEGLLSSNDSALLLHNKVRAFSIWPGCKIVLQIQDQVQELKIVRTLFPDAVMENLGAEIGFAGGHLLLRCKDGSILRVTQVQPAGKRTMAAADYWNGIKGKTIKWLEKDEIPLKT